MCEWKKIDMSVSMYMNKCELIGGSADWEDALEEGMATHSSILAWRIPMDRGAWRAKRQTQLSHSAQHGTAHYVTIKIMELC